MTTPELAITAIVYAITLMLGQRGIAMVNPQWQEGAFALAAVVASATAAFLYHRREARPPARRVVLIVGALLAILAVVVGLFTQALWQASAAPIIALPIAAVVAFLLPLVMFPLIESSMSADSSPDPATPIRAGHIALACVTLVLTIAACLAMPKWPRFAYQFILHQLPGVDVSLPDWPVADKSDLFDYGRIRVNDPRVGGHYISVDWSDGDRVQPDDYVKMISDNPVLQRSTSFIGGHEGVSFFLKSSEEVQEMITLWNCPTDHRVMWVRTFLSGSELGAVHERVVESVRCHTGNRPEVKPVFPNFAPPAGFTREQQPKTLSFVGPKEETIAFPPASSARSPLVGQDVTPEKIASMLKALDLMQSIEVPPTLRTVQDVVGHERRVWSALGSTRDGVTVQVDLMVWFCDVRNMTFLGAYRTKNSHDVQESIDVLLPAVCHTSE